MNKGMRIGYAGVSSSGQKLEDKDVDLVVLDQGIDTTTIYGRLQFNILAAIGEFEREIIRECSLKGRMRALARGVKFGARPKPDREELGQLVKDFEAPGCGKAEIAEHYGISRPSVCRLYAENRLQCARYMQLFRNPETMLIRSASRHI